MPRRCSASERPLLQRVLAPRRLLRALVGVHAVLLDQPGDRLPGKAGLAVQVAAGDRVPLGVGGEPALPAGEELLHLVLRDPVVLLVVEDRDEDVEVGEEVLEAGGRGQRDVVVRALPPLGEGLVQREPAGLDRVAEGLEQPAEERLSPRAGEDAGSGPRAGSAVAARSGRSRERPFRADP